MSRIVFVITAAMMMSFATVACSSEPEEQQPFLTVTPQSLDFAFTGGDQTIAVSSSIQPTVICETEWLTVTTGTYSGSSSIITVTAEKNTALSNRTGTIKIYGDRLSTAVEVKQGMEASTLTLEKSEVKMTCAKSTSEIKAVSNRPPSVKSNKDWCAASVDRPDDQGVSHITISASDNLFFKERSAVVTVTAGLKVENISVTQDKAGAITTASVTKVTPSEITSILGMGWNLGNQFDAHNNGVAKETAWGNQKATQQTFDKVKAAGFTTVRIPVTWMGNFSSAPYYTISDAYLDRLYEVVGYAENAGLNVIINIHHDGADSQYWLNIKEAAASATKAEQIEEQFAQIWHQIALKFKEKGDFLIFEPFNEIHDGGWGWGKNRTDGGVQYGIINSWNQTFVNVVRSTGGNNATRWLSVVGYSSDPDLTMDNLKIPADYTTENRLLVGVHFYSPTEYTLECKYSEWGHTGASGKKANWGDEDNVTTIFGKLRSKFISNGYPVYIGETGCSRRSETRDILFQKYYLEYVFKAAHEYGMAPIVWDNGATGTGRECHGYFEHGTGEYIGYSEEVVKIMRKAVFDNDAAYTLKSVYDSAP